MMKSRYHELDLPLNPDPYPEGISPLHLLYPGRPMTVLDSPDRTNIPNEDPAGALRTFETSKRETLTYAKNLENLTRREGGGDKNKVMARPAVDPTQMIEDPELKGLAMVDPPRQNNFFAPPPISPPPPGEFEYFTPTGTNKPKHLEPSSVNTIIFIVSFMILAIALIFLFL
jgi:hypothetical protein